VRHTSYFIGGPLNKKKTVTQLNVCRQIIFRDKQNIVHLYEQHSFDKEKAFVCYRYLGPATKNFDGEWIPNSK
jgi:hypothetical protein